MDPAYAEARKEQSRPKKAMAVGKLSDLSKADLGASKTVAVAVDPASAPMEDIPRTDAQTQTGGASAKEGGA